MLDKGCDEEVREPVCPDAPLPLCSAGLGAIKGVLWLALWKRHSSFSALPLGMGTLVWLFVEKRSR